MFCVQKDVMEEVCASKAYRIKTCSLPHGQNKCASPSGLSSPGEWNEQL